MAGTPISQDQNHQMWPWFKMRVPTIPKWSEILAILSIRVIKRLGLCGTAVVVDQLKGHEYVDQVHLPLLNQCQLLISIRDGTKSTHFRSGVYTPIIIAMPILQRMTLPHVSPCAHDTHTQTFHKPITICQLEELFTWRKNIKIKSFVAGSGLIVSEQLQPFNKNRQDG